MGWKQREGEGGSIEQVSTGGYDIPVPHTHGLTHKPTLLTNLVPTCRHNKFTVSVMEQELFTSRSMCETPQINNTNMINTYHPKSKQKMS